MAVYSVNNSNGRFTLRLTLTEGSYNITNNTSPVDYKLELVANTSWNFETFSIGRKVVLDGKTVYEVTRANSSKLSIAKYGTLELAKGSTPITHNDDGSKSIPVAYSIDMASADYSPGALSGSGTMALTPIPRASQPSLSTSNFNMGDSITINMNSKSSSFTHTVQCKIGSTTLDIANKIYVNTLWNTSVLFPYCKSSKLLTGSIIVTTYNGSTKIGDPQSVAFTATVAETSATKPTVSIESLAWSEGTIDWVTTPWVQGKSKVTASLKGSAKASADIASYTLGVAGAETSLSTTSTSATITSSGYVNATGNVQITAKVTDSRGIPSDIATDSITVVPYDEPFLAPSTDYTKIYCARCDENGELKESGEFLKVIFKANWYSLANKENTATISVRCYNNKYDSGWKDIAYTENGGGASNNYISWCNIDTKVDGITLELDSSYTVEIRCLDKFGADDTIPFPIPTSKVCFHLGKYGNKAAFGKYAETDNALEIADDWKLILNGASVADFIVYQGESDIWNYRVWRSGKCELWGIATALHPAGHGTETVECSVTYPFTVNNPVVSCQVGAYGWNIARPIYAAVGTGSLTVSIYPRTDIAGNSYHLHIHIFGYLKEGG